MVSLDTNVILRLLLNDVPSQAQEVRALFLRAKPHSLVVEDAVFLECVWILSGPHYNFGRGAIAELLLGIVNMQPLRCNRSLVERVMSLYVQYPSISLIDLVLAAYAELAGATPLLTFDKAFAKKLPGVTSTDVAGAV